MKPTKATQRNASRKAAEASAPSPAPAAPPPVTTTPAPTAPAPASVPFGQWVRIIADPTRVGVVRFEPEWPADRPSDWAWVRVCRPFRLPRFRGAEAGFDVQVGQLVKLVPNELTTLVAGGFVEPILDQVELVEVRAIAHRAPAFFRPGPLPAPLSVNDRLRVEEG